MAEFAAKNQTRYQRIATELIKRHAVCLRNLINALHPAEIAHLLESMQPGDRKIVWALVENKIAGEVLVELNDEVRNGLIEVTDARDLISAAGTLESDGRWTCCAIYRRCCYSGSRIDEQAGRVRCSATPTTAPAAMSLDTLTVRADVEIDVVLRYLRWHGNSR
jgi:magnesium transporter